MEIELPDGTILEAPDGADPSVVAKNYLRSSRRDALVASRPGEFDPSSKEYQDRFGATPGLVAQVSSGLLRPLAKAIAAPANMAGDFLQGLDYYANRGIDKLLGREPTPPPMLMSQGFENALNQVTLAPQSTADKIGEGINTVLAGAMVPGPIPMPKSNVPDNYNSVTNLRREIMRQASKEGYVAPPSSFAPTTGNRLMEGLSGKLKLGQMAQERNQNVTDMLSARALGEKSGAPVTPGAISAIRQEAGRVGYEPIRRLGEIATDDAYKAALDAVTAGGKGAERSFPGIRPASPIDDIVSSLRQDKFDAGDGLDAISHLRSLADDAYSAGQKALGKQYKSAAKAVEDVIERGLKSRGEDGASALESFRNARELIAKTYTASKASVGDSGQFNAASYASQAAKGAPLSGDQRTIANFAQSFGRYVKKPTGDTVPQLSPLDVYGSGMASAASGSPLPFLYPLTRAGLREYLLSPGAQKSALNSSQAAIPPWLNPNMIANILNQTKDTSPAK